MVVCSVLTVGLAAYQHDWDDSFYVMCNTRQGETLYRVQSVHSNSKGDHRWMWQCKRIVSGAMFKCRWSAWSEYGKQVDSDSQCKDTGVVGYEVLSGMKSVHSNQVEDRKWSFYCCTSTRFCPRQCRWSNYINNWGGYMHYIAPHIRVFTGVKSDYDPMKK